MCKTQKAKDFVSRLLAFRGLEVFQKSLELIRRPMPISSLLIELSYYRWSHWSESGQKRIPAPGLRVRIRLVPDVYSYLRCKSNLLYYPQSCPIPVLQDEFFLCCDTHVRAAGEAEPNHDTNGTAIDKIHEPYLGKSFLEIFLVDAYGICPYSPFR